MTTIGWLDQTYFLLGLLPSLLTRNRCCATRDADTDDAGQPRSTHKVLILGKGVGTPALKGCSFKIRVT